MLCVMCQPSSYLKLTGGRLLQCPEVKDYVTLYSYNVVENEAYFVMESQVSYVHDLY